MPRRVWTADWIATSSGVPAASVPPLSTYSPSEFSRTTTRSIGSLAAQRARHAAEGLGRPDVGVQTERLTQLNQRRQRDAVGQPRRPAERSQQDRVKASERGQEIFRHYPSVTVVVGHAPVEAFGSRDESRQSTRSAAATTASEASRTSGPMPSPG